MFGCFNLLTRSMPMIFLEIFLKVLAVEYYIEFIVNFDNRVSLFLF